MNLDDLPDVLSVREAAKFLNISPATYYRGVAQNELPYRRAKGRIVVPKKALAEYLGFEYVPKTIPRVPLRVITEVAELAKALAEATERLAKICAEIGGEDVGKEKQPGSPGQAVSGGRG